VPIGLCHVAMATGAKQPPAPPSSLSTIPIWVVAAAVAAASIIAIND